MTGRPWHEPTPPTADEFAPGAADPPDEPTRRAFLALAGASAALAGSAGCRRPREQIVPFVRQPEGVVPGTSRFYATTLTTAGGPTGVLVESRDGRPIKVEGNELHPASLGATDAFAQAEILALYDPDRSQAVLQGDRPRSWPDALAALRAAVARARGKPNHPVRVLTGTVSSPTLARQLERLLEALPEARWHVHEPVDRSPVREGVRRAFGPRADPVYHFDQANVVLALDADFLASGPGHLRYAREFMSRRRVWNQAPAAAAMNRLYAAGPTPTPTGATADHWLPLTAADVGPFARAVAARLGVSGVPPEAGAPGRFREDWLAGVVADLRANEGRAVVVAGDAQTASVHALAHAINAHRKGVGATVSFVPEADAIAAKSGTLAELVADMRDGRVEALVVLESNPVFTAAADLEFARHLTNVPFRLHLGLHRDESARLCEWHVPATHALEEWGDTRTFDGTASLVQPLISPLYGGVSALRLVATLGGEERSPYELVRAFWRAGWKDDFDARWNKALQDGAIADSTPAPAKAELKPDWHPEPDPGPASGALEVVFRPDPTVFDGRYANNGGLQELPKPLTKLTWDGVAVVGPATARELGLTRENGDRGGGVSVDVAELRYRGRSVEAPVWVQPGHAEGSVTVYFGNGRTAAGRAGTGVGFDGYALRTSDRPWFDGGLEVRKIGRRYRLATTQLHHTISGESPARGATLRDYRANPASVAGRRSLPLAGEPPSLYEEYPYPGRKWGMVIDLTACTGCSACVVACQAENNIPVVGKEQVARGREMHWLRVDSYHTGDADQPGNTYFQPVPCTHCENAPCEYVCPVNATVHSPEGLNDMVYNRCVGTRYCSNNCPYKVRRFNFLAYADWGTESLKPMRNPEVTVRSRGVMEKCTYCVQRIRAAEVHAELDGRAPVANRAGTLLKPIDPHELLTACQAVCPTGAIVFGDLNAPGSPVAAMRENRALNYGLLADELGTRPRTTYLAALKNPNPDITG